MPAESFIDDIPFKTHIVTSEVMLNKAMTVEFDLAEETCINDISVDTKQIVQEITIADPMKSHSLWQKNKLLMIFHSILQV